MKPGDGEAHTHEHKYTRERRDLMQKAFAYVLVIIIPRLLHTAEIPKQSNRTEKGSLSHLLYEISKSYLSSQSDACCAQKRRRDKIQMDVNEQSAAHASESTRRYICHDHPAQINQQLFAFTQLRQG